ERDFTRDRLEGEISVDTEGLDRAGEHLGRGAAAEAEQGDPAAGDVDTGAIGEPARHPGAGDHPQGPTDLPRYRDRDVGTVAPSEVPHPPDEPDEPGPLA